MPPLTYVIKKKKKKKKRLTLFTPKLLLVSNFQNGLDNEP